MLLLRLYFVKAAPGRYSELVEALVQDWKDVLKLHVAEQGCIVNIFIDLVGEPFGILVEFGKDGGLLLSECVFGKPLSYRV